MKEAPSVDVYCFPEKDVILNEKASPQDLLRIIREMQVELNWRRVERRRLGRLSG